MFLPQNHGSNTKDWPWQCKFASTRNMSQHQPQEQVMQASVFCTCNDVSTLRRYLSTSCTCIIIMKYLCLARARNHAWCSCSMFMNWMWRRLLTSHATVMHNDLLSCHSHAQFAFKSIPCMPIICHRMHLSRCTAVAVPYLQTAIVRYILCVVVGVIKPVSYIQEPTHWFPCVNKNECWAWPLKQWCTGRQGLWKQSLLEC